MIQGFVKVSVSLVTEMAAGGNMVVEAADEIVVVVDEVAVVMAVDLSMLSVVEGRDSMVSAVATCSFVV